jgi:hypothetical protein
MPDISNDLEKILARRRNKRTNQSKAKQPYSFLYNIQKDLNLLFYYLLGSITSQSVWLASIINQVSGQPGNS